MGTAAHGFLMGGFAMEKSINVIEEKENEKRENVISGTVGAFLFSLVGGVLWYIVYQLGYVASICGIVGMACAIKGYEVFAKKESAKGLAISAVCAIFTIVCAWYLCLSTDVYQAYQDWYMSGEIDYTLTFPEAFRTAWLYLEEPEVARPYLADLIKGLLFSLLGAAGFIVDAIRKVFSRKKTAADDIF